MTRYESAKEIYAKLGVDTDAAIEKCMQVPVSLHCWQGDDVTGFDHDGPLTGGIQTTGNYPGKARTPEELMADMDKARRSMCMRAMQFLKMGSSQTATSWSQNISRNGWTLQKKEEWDWISIRHSSLMRK